MAIPNTLRLNERTFLLMKDVLKNENYRKKNVRSHGFGVGKMDSK